MKGIIVIASLILFSGNVLSAQSSPRTEKTKTKKILKQQLKQWDKIYGHIEKMMADYGNCISRTTDRTDSIADSTLCLRIVKNNFIQTDSTLARYIRSAKKLKLSPEDMATVLDDATVIQNLLQAGINSFDTKLCNVSLHDVFLVWDMNYSRANKN